MSWTRWCVAAALVGLSVTVAGCTSAKSAANSPTSATLATTGRPLAQGQATATATSGELTEAPSAVTPTAQAIGLEPQVGPLFAAGDSHPHGCSASVLHSPGRDLIITAAHCIRGTGVGQVFAPDYRDGIEPFGRWRVLRAWASPEWNARTDPDLDVAVLQVAGRLVSGHLDQVEDVVGAETLGSTPLPGAVVTVVGYVQGKDDRQVTCTNVLTRSAEFPAFSCHGYEGGTSGSPFLTGSRPRVVVGLIGGRDLGGCTEAVSYSPPFGAAVAALVARAVGSDTPDSLPTASDNC